MSGVSVASDSAPAAITRSVPLGSRSVCASESSR
jgi:hypothetical protein